MTAERDRLIELGRQAAREHRAERGLPEKVTDPVVLAEIAAMLRRPPLDATQDYSNLG